MIKEEILNIIVKILTDQYNYKDVVETTIVAKVPITNDWSEQLKLIDLSFDLEKELNIEIPVIEIMEWKTVADIINTCQKHIV